MISFLQTDGWSFVIVQNISSIQFGTPNPEGGVLENTAGEGVPLKCITGAADAPAPGARPTIDVIEASGMDHYVEDDGEGGVYDAVLTFMRQMMATYSGFVP